ncbi:MAG: SDR family NAD(P)-dependent oxidoreductase [Planctomycetes bacterium]|nr:SDR family NAD(P)-dependent oxidoreductase [Planctomycetota bacterium]
MNASFWQSKTVIITGGSSGIGQALAEYIAPSGARIGLLGRDEARLRAACESARTLGSAQAEWAACDITDAAATQAAIRTLESRLGPCDVLIAGAGIHRHTNGRTFLAEDANAVVATNVNGVINAFGAVLPGMVARGGGRLVAISSLAALRGLPTSGAYSASKAAVRTLCDGIRVDLRHTGVQVTTILPGFVDTPMLGRERREKIPRILSPGQAADRIASAIERGRTECAFPLRTHLVAWIISRLPLCVYGWLWDWAVQKKRARRQPGGR